MGIDAGDITAPTRNTGYFLKCLIEDQRAPVQHGQ
jgi:hypothetical protein